MSRRTAGVDVQPKAHVTLADGYAEHLKTVHGLTPDHDRAQAQQEFRP